MKVKLLHCLIVQSGVIGLIIGLILFAASAFRKLSSIYVFSYFPLVLRAGYGI